MALEQGGNASARRIWLSNFSTHNGPEPENDADVRSFMRQKYFEYKWLDREALYTHEKMVKEMIKSAFTDVSLIYIETFLFCLLIFYIFKGWISNWEYSKVLR
jgi:hypothetical protein